MTTRKQVKRLTTGYLKDPVTGAIMPRRAVGGKADSVNSKTPSLDRPNSDYSRIVRLLQENLIVGVHGLRYTAMTDLFNKTYGTNIKYQTFVGKLGRLVAKKILLARPDPNNAGKTLYSLPYSRKHKYEYYK